LYLYLLFIIPPLLFMIYARWRVISAYKKYSRVANMAGVSGAEAARTLLRHNGPGGVGGARISVYGGLIVPAKGSGKLLLPS
jgi:Zn-dependent membrane protease YugP